ncbi:MAG: hypothetical protein ACFFCS_04550 [Candidatus Hodarchaeota archaeon]
MDILSYLKRVWTGTCNKLEFMIWLCIAFGVYVLGIIVGAAVYPGGFTMLEVYVSYLGGYPNNPDGYAFYNTCTLIAGILIAPEYLYLYRKLKPAMKWVNFIGSLFGIFGALSFASLGIFYQGFDADLHQWSTILTFGGFGVNAGLYMIVMIRRSAWKKDWPKWWQIVLVYAIMFGILISTIIADEYPGWFDSWNLDPKVFEDKFLEWWYVFAVMSWVISVPAITPSGRVDA